jgi:5,6-dimethylbenzimidazole synthase
VPDELLDDLIEIATHAPSVGLSQPWRFVKVKSPERRRAVWESFAKANERALGGYEGEQRANYVSLKLAGLKEAPIHLAVFADESTTTGSGLGRQTMPETLRYSVVAAVQTCGSRRAPRGWAWDGCRSSIPPR